MFIRSCAYHRQFRACHATAVAAVFAANVGVAVASAVPDLICHVVADAAVATNCSGVPALANGQLSLSENGTFTLTGRYDACHQIENVRIEGTFEAAPHDNGVDYELLARRTFGGDPGASNRVRTIGLVNLDSRSLKARFTDTAALIRSRGQMAGAAPSVPMACSEN